jgi:hypothetical protein
MLERQLQLTGQLVAPKRKMSQIRELAQRRWDLTYIEATSQRPKSMQNVSATKNKKW